jgi:hypothetical protein
MIDNADEIIILDSKQISINSGLNLDELKFLWKDIHCHISGSAISAFIYAIAQRKQKNVVICLPEIFNQSTALDGYKEFLIGEITNWDTAFLLFYSKKNWKLIIHEREQELLYFDPSPVRRCQQVTKNLKERIFEVVSRLYGVAFADQINCNDDEV